jgi:MFS family permease
MAAPLLILLLCLALVLNLLGFMTVAAVLPQLISDWFLTSTEAGWLGGIYFAGYVSAVPILASLTDRIDARRIYLLSALLGACASFAFALAADGISSAIILRFLSGLGLAGVYMPGLKALTDTLPKQTESRAVTYYTAVFALGTAASFLAGGEVAAAFGWRWAFGVAGLGSVAGAAIATLALRRQLPGPTPSPDGAASGFVQVFRNRRAMGYIVAFFGYAWEVFAFRVWIVVFLAYIQARAADTTGLLSPTHLATIIALCGVVANMVFGEAANVIGRRRVLIGLCLVSMMCGLLTGYAVGAAYGVIIALCVAFGTSASARNAPTMGGTVAAADPMLRGTTMGVHASIGYAGGVVGPIVAGVALDLAGGMDSPHAWLAAFAAIAVGPVISIVALTWLARGRAGGSS